MPLKRTEYADLSTATPRGGATERGESLTDMENYLLPLDQVRGSSLYGWGVADGLRVSATSGQAGVTVSTGAALDAAGNIVVLATGSFAIVDPNADPNDPRNIATVPVGAGGLVLSTTGLTGDLLLTMTWREVLDDAQQNLYHAPWLRLLPVAGFQDVGKQVVLAQVTLDRAGLVTGLSTGPRRAVGVPAGRLELRSPQAAAGAGLSVDQVPVSEVRARADGGLDFNLLSSGGAARLALSVQGVTGNVGIGIDAQRAGRILHVEGSEVHSGGPAGGFSFANRETAAFVQNPRQGERWVWYASGGSARLWSGGDRLTIDLSGDGGGLDVPRRMRVRQGGDFSAGIWFHQRGPNADTAFVGMVDDTHVGFYGNTGIGWGLQMDTSTGNVGIGIGAQRAGRILHVEGSEVHSGGSAGGFSFANRETAAFVEHPRQGERWVWYASGGSARLWSGGDRLTIDTTGNVGIGTASPECSLAVHSPGNAIAAYAGEGFPGFHTVGVEASGHIGVRAFSNDYIGVVAVGRTKAGYFVGDVEITGALSGGGGGFLIDHPLDPANQYLSHSFVQSPEMTNIYNGTIVTDDRGEATVVLPDYFEALNRDYCYQLTPIGQPALAVVTGEVRDNSFTIRTDRPAVRVSWQVTGVRQDPWANAHRIVAEEAKPEAEQDLYLHPEVHEQPASKNVLSLITGGLCVGERR